jgi:hypothetical protein
MVVVDYGDDDNGDDHDGDYADNGDDHHGDCDNDGDYDNGGCDYDDKGDMIMMVLSTDGDGSVILTIRVDRNICRKTSRQ